MPAAAQPARKQTLRHEPVFIFFTTLKYPSTHYRTIPRVPQQKKKHKTKQNKKTKKTKKNEKKRSFLQTRRPVRRLKSPRQSLQTTCPEGSPWEGHRLLVGWPFPQSPVLLAAPGISCNKQGESKKAQRTHLAIRLNQTPPP